MTNREYMAKQLSDPDLIDDGGASYLSMVEYNIGCPYFHGDERYIAEICQIMNHQQDSSAVSANWNG